MIPENEGKEALEFLDAFEGATRRIYTAGISKFLSFYRSSGEGKNVSDFLDTLEADLKLPRRQRERVGEKVIRDFIKYMKDENLSPKSIRTYVAAIQSLCKYFDLTISTRYVDMPSSRPVSDKFPWTLDKVAAFIGKIEDPEIKSIAVTIFQSGLSISDILALNWGDIRLEYERDIIPLCFDLARIKTDVPFMTFLGEWGVSLLSHHLEGKRFRLEDPLYTVSHRLIDLHFERLGKKWIGTYKGHNPMRPHSLRAAFRTILGESDCPYDVIEFWMGHELPEQVRVYNSRTRDGWRAFYKKYEPYLTPSSFKG